VGTASGVMMTDPEKLVAIEWGRQPDYADLLAYANRRLHGEVVVLAHTDIYFDESIACVATALARGDAAAGDATTNATRSGAGSPRDKDDGDGARRGGALFAITRRPAPTCARASGGGHVPGVLPTNLCASSTALEDRVDVSFHGYDAFAFASPVPVAIVEAMRGVKQNVLGSDLRLVDAFDAAGYAVYNPCAHVAAYHLHCTRERAYDFDATNRDLDSAVSVTKLSASRRFNALCAKTEAPTTPARLPRPTPPRDAPSPQGRRPPLLRGGEHEPLLVASFPRSGSTMLRRIVERAMRTHTGSTHFDPTLLMDERFLGEGYCDGGHVSVVKTHHPAVKDFGPRDCRALLVKAHGRNASAALLVRDPFDAVRSYWEYTIETRPKTTIPWRDFAVVEARRWRLLVEYWRDAVDLTLRYEDFLAMPDETLHSVLRLVCRRQEDCGGDDDNAVESAIRERVRVGLSDADDVPKQLRHGAREAHYDRELATAVFLAAGAHEVLCPLGYEPPKLVGATPCPKRGTRRTR